MKCRIRSCKQPSHKSYEFCWVHYLKETSMKEFLKKDKEVIEK